MVEAWRAQDDASGNGDSGLRLQFQGSHAISFEDHEYARHAMFQRTTLHASMSRLATTGDEEASPVRRSA
jgi:hypothetical protein